MRITIHQPEHLPWLGLLAKVAVADLWVVLDSVPYRKNYFQNRNRLLLDGKPSWLTVPVTAPFGTLIRDVHVAAEPNWRRIYRGRLLAALRHAHTDRRFGSLLATIDAANERDDLLSLNLAGIRWLLAEYGIDTPLVLASELGVSGRKSELIKNLCVAAGADEYIAGPSGRDYLDLHDFTTHRIRVWFFDFEHPTYDQGQPFVAAMSGVDGWSRRPNADLPELISHYRLSPS